MYSFQNINLHFGDFQLFDNVSFVISPGDKVALVGKNGAGKTTLFKILTGEIEADTSDITMPRDTSIGYLSQHLDFEEGKTIQEACLECFKKYFDAEARIEEINKLLQVDQTETHLTKLLDELDQLNITIASLNVSNPYADTAKILKGFGFKEEQLDDKISTLSGGWKMRVQMSKLLLTKPDLLLLDEPDNHLDIEALIWFEKYLKNYQGAILFISHDIDFMSNVASRILELSNRKLFDFKGSYKNYLDGKELRQEKEEQAFVNQQKVIKEKERTITRFMAKATKTKMAQSMKKQLDKMERIELTQEDVTQIKIQFPMVHAPGKIVTTIKNAYKSYGDKKVLEDVSLVLERGQKIGFVGQNGQGKSTLVKMIAKLTPYDKGTVELGHNVLLSYFAQDQAETLDTSKTVLETIKDKADAELQTKCRNILGAFAFSGEDAEKKVSVLSGGEKSRLSMACLVSQKSNFLILDEPTNHLDIHAKAILKKAIMEYPGTMIIVSHDREILRGTVDITYEFRDRKIIQYLGDLDYVLQKREVDDVREFALSDAPKKNDKQKAKAKNELSYEESKKINRNISRLEKRIDECEKEKKEIHEKLLDSSYYNSPEGTAALKKLSKIDTNLDKYTEEWDTWVSKLD